MACPFAVLVYYGKTGFDETCQLLAVCSPRLLPPQHEDTCIRCPAFLVPLSCLQICAMTHTCPLHTGWSCTPDAPPTTSKTATVMASKRPAFLVPLICLQICLMSHSCSLHTGWRCARDASQLQGLHRSLCPTI